MDTALNRFLDTILGALDLFRFWIVLDEYEEGIILRLGRFHHVVGPGLHWRRPMRVDVLQFENVKKKQASSWEMTQTTKSGTTVSIAFTYLIHIIDVKKVLLELDDWSLTAYRASKIVVSRNVEESEDEDIFSEDFTDHLRVEVEERLRSLGIGLDDFGLTERARTRAYRLFNGAK